jgi:hypothetical protein
MPATLAQLVKADFQGFFAGTASSLAVDRDKEKVSDWNQLKSAFTSWSQGQNKATFGRSWGNIRDMHSDKVVGVLTEPPRFNESDRTVHVVGKVVGEENKAKLEAGLWSALSIGGSYKSRQPLGGGITGYVPDIIELSLCDVPCNPEATLDYVKVDGTTVRKRFVRGAARMKLLKALAVTYAFSKAAEQGVRANVDHVEDSSVAGPDARQMVNQVVSWNVKPKEEAKTRRPRRQNRNAKVIDWPNAAE